MCLQASSSSSSRGIMIKSGTCLCLRHWVNSNRQHESHLSFIQAHREGSFGGLSLSDWLPETAVITGSDQSNESTDVAQRLFFQFVSLFVSLPFPPSPRPLSLVSFTLVHIFSRASLQRKFSQTFGAHFSCFYVFKVSWWLCLYHFVTELCRAHQSSQLRPLVLHRSRFLLPSNKDYQKQCYFFNY